MADKPKEAKKTSEAEAAAGEAQGQPLTITFRGRDFTIPVETFESARLLLAMASNEGHRMMFEVLAGEPSNFPRFLATIRTGESLVSVAEEFFGALEAAGQGNS